MQLEMLKLVESSQDKEAGSSLMSWYKRRANSERASAEFAFKHGKKTGIFSFGVFLWSGLLLVSRTAWVCQYDIRSVKLGN